MSAHGGAPSGEEQRSTISEEPTVKFGGPTFKNIQPKTYQILEQELSAGHVTIGGQIETRDPTQMPTQTIEQPVQTGRSQ